MLVAWELSDDSENILMVDDHTPCGHHKRRCNDGASLHRSRCRFSCDDAATVIGICVGLLAVVTGALVFIVCFELLTVLSRVASAVDILIQKLVRCRLSTNREQRMTEQEPDEHENLWTQERALSTGI